jgi:hypothetical protein
VLKSLFIFIRRSTPDEIGEAIKNAFMQLEGDNFTEGYNKGFNDAENHYGDLTWEDIDDDDESDDDEELALLAEEDFDELVRREEEDMMTVLVSNLTRYPNAPVIPVTELNGTTNEVYSVIMMYCRPQDYLNRFDIQGHSLYVFSINVGNNTSSVQGYAGFIVPKDRIVPVAHLIAREIEALSPWAHQWVKTPTENIGSHQF